MCCCSCWRIHDYCFVAMLLLLVVVVVVLLLVLVLLLLLSLSLSLLLLLLLLLLLKLLLSLILCSCVCVHAFVKQEEALKVCGLLAQLHTASGRWLCATVVRGSGPPRTCYVCVLVRFLLTSLSCPLELVPTATKRNCTRGS